MLLCPSWFNCLLLIFSGVDPMDLEGTQHFVCLLHHDLKNNLELYIYCDYSILSKRAKSESPRKQRAGLKNG